MKNTNKKEVLQIETFPNPVPGRDYTIEMECPEFTCLCPKTGQPDFAILHISYIPEKLCLELKSLKIYLVSYRNEGGFHEKVTNIILDDLVSACRPRKMTIVGEFNVRGESTLQLRWNMSLKNLRKRRVNSRFESRRG